MIRRLWTRRLTPATLAAFLATVAAPRPGILVHHHAGGGLVHVHANEGAGTPDHDDGDDDHDHQVLRPGETALASLEPAEGWHAHARCPFQLGARPAAARLDRVEALSAVRPMPHAPPLAAPARGSRARAPPLPAAF